LLFTGNAFAESPYQGMQGRTVKALSEQQVVDLNEGRGMGMALAAELNGYPMFEGLTSVRPTFESHRDGDHEPKAITNLA
jgi:hypothetical protein